MAQIIFRPAQQDTTVDPTDLTEAISAIVTLRTRYNELVAVYNQLMNYLNRGPL